MSFGGSQSTVRYALMVDDQASLKIQNINRQFVAMGNQVGQLQTRINTFNSAINNNSRAFTASVNSIKTQGNALANNTKQLAANSTQITTLGGKIKATASQFAGFASGLAITTSGALQLAAGFRDYNDAQIAVDRVQRKLSLATEAQRKAQDKLNDVQHSGKATSKDLAQAQLDVSQANAAVKIQTDLLGEAQERMFDSQTQFVASVIPTTLGALGTLGSAFKDLGGTKGIGGLTEKFKGLGGLFTGIIPSITGIGTKSTEASTKLTSLGTAAASSAGGVTTLKGALSGLAFGLGTIVGIPLAGIFAAGQLQQNVKEFGTIVAATRIKQLEFLKALGATDEQLKTVNDMWNTLNKTLGLYTVQVDTSTIGTTKVTKATNDWANAIKFIPPSLNAAAKSGDAWVNMMVKALQSSDPQKIIEFNAAFKASGQSVERYQEIVRQADALIKSFDQTMKETNKTFVETTKVVKQATITTGDLWKTWDIGGGKMAMISDSFGASLTTLKAKFLALNKARENFNALSQAASVPGPLFGNPTAITKTVQDFKNLADLAARTNATAKDLIKTWTKDAPPVALKQAAEAAAKLKQALAGASSGLDKIIEAFHKTHKGKLDFEVDFKRANKKVDEFLGDWAKKFDKGGIEGAKKFTENFVNKSVSKFKGESKRIFDPLVEFVKKHGKDAPDVWLREFLNFVKDFSPSVFDVLKENQLPTDEQMAKVGKTNGTSYINSALAAITNKGAGLASFWESAGTKVKGFGPSQGGTLKPGQNEFTMGVGDQALNMLNNAKRKKPIKEHDMQNNPPGGFGPISAMAGGGGAGGALMQQVAAVSKAITDLGKLHPQITLLNTNAITAVQTTAGEITNLGKIQPQIALQNRNAFSVIDTTGSGITDLGKLKPQISLQNRNAFSAIDTTGDEIKKLEKLKPQISLQNRNAINAIETVASEIKKLENIHPEIKVKFSGSASVHASAGLSAGGKVSISQHGQKEMLTEDQTIFAHKGEFVAIGRPEQGKIWNTGLPNGGGSGGDTYISINVLDETIMRKIERRSARNRFTMGV